MTITPNILYRISDTPDVPVATTSKGTPLTSREIDGNFKSIQNSIATVSTGVSTTSIDANTDLSTLVDHAGMRYYVQKVEAAKPKQHVYTVISTGLQSPYRDRTGIYKNGLIVRGGARSYNLIKIDKSSGDIVYQNSFDLYTDHGQYSVAIDLANELNATTESQHVILYTYDEPSYNHLTTELQDAIYRCGGSKAIYGSSEFAYRSAYILIGGYNLGEGNGVELYRGRSYTAPDGIQGDPDAYLEVSFQIIDGKLCGIGNDSSTAFGYVSKDELRDVVDNTIADIADDIAELSTTVETKLAKDSLIGSVTYFAMTSVDAGWLPCDGSAYSRTEHAKLYAKISTLYGSGDGSSTFNVPNLFDEFIRGIGANRAISSWQGDEIRSHSHKISINLKSRSGSAATISDGGWDDTYYYEQNTNATGGDETRPRNVALLPCIYSGAGTAAQFESFTLTPGANTVFEGDSINFTVTGIGTTNRSSAYWTVVGSASDFVSSSGTVSLSNMSGSFTVNTVKNAAVADRTFSVRLYDDATKSKLLSQTGTVTIIDTSIVISSVYASVDPWSGNFYVEISGKFLSGTVFYITQKNGTGELTCTASQPNFASTTRYINSGINMSDPYGFNNEFEIRSDSYTGNILTTTPIVHDNSQPVSSTCFPKDSAVLLYNGESKAIQDITIADVLMGANGKPTTVQKLDTPILGNRKMYQFTDGHTWSEEHAHWVYDNETQREWWWSANADMWRNEVASGAIRGLKDNASIIDHNNIKFAHISGFVAREIIAVDYAPETQLYLPITDGTPIIVNGYVVGAGVNEFDFDYTSFQWIPSCIKELK